MLIFSFDICIQQHNYTSFFLSFFLSSFQFIFIEIDRYRGAVHIIIIITIHNRAHISNLFSAWLNFEQTALLWLLTARFKLQLSLWFISCRLLTINILLEICVGFYLCARIVRGCCFPAIDVIQFIYLKLVNRLFNIQKEITTNLPTWDCE